MVLSYKTEDWSVECIDGNGGVEKHNDGTRDLNNSIEHCDGANDVVKDDFLVEFATCTNKFRNLQGMDYVINQSPWKVNDKPLFVQNGILVLRGISTLASRLGRPIMMDSMTASMCHKGVGRAGRKREYKGKGRSGTVKRMKETEDSSGECIDGNGGVEKHNDGTRDLNHSIEHCDSANDVVKDDFLVEFVPCTNKFRNLQGMDYVINQSPWKVNDKPLFVQNGILVLRGISTLASRLGRPIMMDSTIASMCHKGVGRAGYARVLVEMDANKGLLEKIEIVYKDAMRNTKND
ncbi:hypothetical protein Tco_0772514 [Tanacetum coccineum]|uniref:DUF4283 domain-containing protein n=1 Tax=Tanacetum coccineum TaxID=301880 RepID=A0ABQ4ZI36_9ASTR